jgi:IS30 family transposase
MASWEKGAIENNHHYIRYYFPKGTSINSLTQEKINIMLSHINSTKRKSIDKHSPYDLARIVLGEKILDAFEITYINPNDVILNPTLLK